MDSGNSSLSLKQRANAVVRNRDSGDPALTSQAEHAFCDELVLRLGDVAGSITEVVEKIQTLPEGLLAARLASLESTSGELTLIIAQLTRVVRCNAAAVA